MSRQSKYALRMAKLSGKIFSEYIRPEMPHEISRAVLIDSLQRDAWTAFHYQNEQVIQRTKDRPADLQPTRNAHYYPAHPQIRDLMATLREHGLYRDEHQDIKDEMARLRALRGKPDRVRASRGSKFTPTSVAPIQYPTKKPQDEDDDQ